MGTSAAGDHALQQPAFVRAILSGARARHRGSQSVGNRFVGVFM
jgi:hypothetical protein